LKKQNYARNIPFISCTLVFVSSLLFVGHFWQILIRGYPLANKSLSVPDRRIINRGSNQNGRLSPKEILIVSQGVPGLWGTASGVAMMTERYALLFSSHGHSVGILLAIWNTGKLSSIREKFTALHNIKVDVLPKIPEVASGSEFMRRSWSIYQFIETEAKYDVVWFFDFAGLALFPLHARFTSKIVSKALAVVSCHGSTRLSRAGNSIPLTLSDLLLINMEDMARSTADVTTFPGTIYRDYANSIHSFGNNEEINSIIVPNFVLGRNHAEPAQHMNFQEIKIAFFGRFCRLKGLHVFMKALGQLAGEGLRPSQLYFIGSAVVENGENTVLLIRRIAEEKNWSNVHIFESWNTSQAISFMLQERAIAVLPSLLETYSLTLLECLLMGVPVVHSDVGEMRSMATFRSNLVRSGSVESLTVVLRKILLKKSIFRDTLSFDINSARTRTLSVLSHKPEVDFFLGRNCSSVTIGIATRDRNHQLLSAIRGFSRQACCCFSVLVLNTGRRLPPEIKKAIQSYSFTNNIDISIIENDAMQDSYISVARDELIRLCTTPYLLFFDDDDFPLPNLLLELYRAAVNSNSDIVTSFSYNLKSGKRWDIDISSIENGKVDDLSVTMATGIVSSHNFYEHLAGNAVMLVRVSKAIEVGGMEVELDTFSPFVDWAFYQKMVYANASIQVVPRPLYVYREGNVGSISSEKTEESVAAGRLKLLRGLCRGLHLSSMVCDLLEAARTEIDK
jgi:glycosyltransferase involved in cell wall biosynthesis